jgi:hypothetical protein
MRKCLHQQQSSTELPFFTSRTLASSANRFASRSLCPGWLIPALLSEQIRF